MSYDETFNLHYKEWSMNNNTVNKIMSWNAYFWFSFVFVRQFKILSHL